MLFTAICRRSEESHSSLRPGTGAASSRLALPACGGAGREPLVRAAFLPTLSVASSLIPSLSLPSGVNRRAVGRARVRRPSDRAPALGRDARDPPRSSRTSSRCPTSPYSCSGSGATSTPRNRPRGRASSVNGSRRTPRSGRPRSAVCRSAAEVRASTLRSPTVLLRRFGPDGVRGADNGGPRSSKPAVSLAAAPGSLRPTKARPARGPRDHAEAVRQPTGRSRSMPTSRSSPQPCSRGRFHSPSERDTRRLRARR